MNIYFILCVTIQFYIIDFVAQIVPSLVMGTFEVGSCVSLMYHHRFIFLSTSSFFWHDKTFQAHLTYFLLTTRISHFSKELWFCSLENEIRNQDLAPRCAHGYWGVVTSKSSQWTELANVSIYTNPCKHIYLQLFLYLSICISIKLNMSSYWCFKL